MILEYAFMQRALVTGILIAMSCAVLGVFLILRKNAFIGEGLAHISFSGIALGIILGMNPILASLMMTVFGALAITYLSNKSRLQSDTSIGILSYTGFALGIILVSMFRGFNTDLFSFLFGNILSISAFDMLFSAGLALLVLIFVFLFYNDLLSITFDEETAKTEGIKAGFLSYALSVLVAVTVVISMRIVGIILVSSLMIIPAAASMQLSKTFRQTMLVSAVLGVLSVIAGLILSYAYDLAAGAAIVVVNFMLFSAAFAYKKAVS